MDSLDDVLQGNDEPEVVEQAAPEPEITKVEEAEPTTEPEPTKQAEPPEVSAFKAQALDERRKRQALEQQLRALEEQQRQIPTEKPDFWENPDAAMDARIAEIQRASDMRFYALAEDMTKGKYSDYEEISDYFVEVLAPQNPGLIEQARNQANPYEFIYKATKAQKELAEVGDINALKAKLRAEVEAELRTSMAKEAEKLAKIPGSLAGQRGASAPTGVEHESLADILGR